MSAEQWHAILEAFNGLCVYCKKRRGNTMDHVVAIARGGKHEPSNVVPACKPCNSSKGTRDVREWLESREV